MILEGVESPSRGNRPQSQVPEYRWSSSDQYFVFFFIMSASVAYFRPNKLEWKKKRISCMIYLSADVTCLLNQESIFSDGSSLSTINLIGCRVYEWKPFVRAKKIFKRSAWKTGWVAGKLGAFKTFTQVKNWRWSFVIGDVLISSYTFFRLHEGFAFSVSCLGDIYVGVCVRVCGDA